MTNVNITADKFASCGYHLHRQHLFLAIQDADPAGSCSHQQRRHEKELSGGGAQTTNNRMELVVVIEAKLRTDGKNPDSRSRLQP